MRCAACVVLKWKVEWYSYNAVCGTWLIKHDRLLLCTWACLWWLIVVVVCVAKRASMFGGVCGAEGTGAKPMII